MATYGLFHAILSAATYGLMSFLVHWNPGNYPVEQMIFLRGVLSVLVLLPFCARDLGKYFHADSLSLWVRSIAGAGGVTCYFYTLQGATSANANVLFSSSPIFVVVLAWIFLRERLTKLELIGVTCIVLGNLLLYIPNREAMPFWVWAAGSGGALFASIAFLSLGTATKKYSSPLIVLGFALASAILALVIPGKPWLRLSVPDLPFLLSVSLLGLVSQLTSTVSFAHLKSSVATAVGRSSILFSGILDVAIAHYRPHALEWVSYVVVLFGIFIARSTVPFPGSTPAPSPGRAPRKNQKLHGKMNI